MVQRQFLETLEMIDRHYHDNTHLLTFQCRLSAQMLGLWPGSKMKCNALECLLKIQAQKGVANEKVPSINSMGKNKDSDVKAIGVLINEDCRSA